MRALVVEEDIALSSGLEVTLRLAGYTVEVCHDQTTAWHRLITQPFDVMLLDLGSPKTKGLELLRLLRRRVPLNSTRVGLPHEDMPILIMTVREGMSDEIDRVIGLADDYIIQPFDTTELLARLRAMRRRASGRSNHTIEHGDLVLDPDTHTVSRAGESVPIGEREFALLHTLLQASPNVLSRSRLESALYGFGQSVESNAIEVHVHHLRRKLGESLIKTVRGVGYFVPLEPTSSP